MKMHKEAADREAYDALDLPGIHLTESAGVY